MPNLTLNTLTRTNRLDNVALFFDTDVATTGRHDICVTKDSGVTYEKVGSIYLTAGAGVTFQFLTKEYPHPSSTKTLTWKLMLNQQSSTNTKTI
jgi:hypothetical protein